MFDRPGLSEILSQPHRQPPYAPSMTLVLCDITALDFWLGDCPVTRTIAPASLCSWVNGITASGPLPEQQLTRLGINTRPVHVLVPKRTGVCHTQRVVSHHVAPPYQQGAFTRLSADVYALTPLACIIRMARSLDDVQLLQLLYKLLGRYRTYGDDLYERTPFMTYEQAAAFVLRARGNYGVKRVRRALQYAQEGARSPAEASASIIFSLPVSAGGFDLPVPMLNSPLSAQRNGVAESRFPDLFWPSYNLALEYQSDEFHTGAERIGADAARRTHLQEAGYTVFELTNYQARRQKELLSLANALRERMGLGELPRSEIYVRKNEALRRQLFGAARI